MSSRPPVTEAKAPTPWAPNIAAASTSQATSAAISWIVLRPLIASMATYRKRKP